MFPLTVEDTFAGNGNLVVNNFEELQIAIKLFKETDADICVMGPTGDQHNGVPVLDCYCRTVKDHFKIEF